MCVPLSVIMLRQDRFTVHLYRRKDGALRKVILKPDGKLTSLCWSMGVAKVKSGSIPLVALKVHKTGGGMVVVVLDAQGEQVSLRAL